MALSVHQPSFDTAKRRTRRHAPGSGSHPPPAPRRSSPEPRKAALGPVFPELAEELRPGQRSLVAGHLGAEGLHEGGGPGGRDAEEPFDVAAGEEGPVELFELADGVGDRVPTRFVQKYTVRARLEPSGAHEAGFRPPCRPKGLPGVSRARPRGLGPGKALAGALGDQVALDLGEHPATDPSRRETLISSSMSPVSCFRVYARMARRDGLSMKMRLRAFCLTDAEHETRHVPCC